MREYLGLADQTVLNIETGNEILLSSKKSRNTVELDVSKDRIRLPVDVISRLGLPKGARVGLVERGSALSIKAFEISEEEGKRARWYDTETPLKITRIVETNPVPERFLARLSEEYKNLSINVDVRAFIQGRKSKEALLIREQLGIAESSDADLKRRRIENLLKQQHEDGSWESSVPLTAGCLRDLEEWGLVRDHPAIRRAVDWLLTRPESPYVPGLWFTTDSMVQEQANVIEKRKRHSGKAAGSSWPRH